MDIITSQSRRDRGLYETKMDNSQVEPIVFDSETPNVSVQNNLFQLSQKQLQLLVDFNNYGIELQNYCTELLREGPVRNLQIPKKPKGDLKYLFREKPSKKNLIGRELNNYMKNRLVMFENTNDMPNLEFTSLESVKNGLQQSWSILKQHQAKVLGYSIECGEKLQRAFDYYSIGKLRYELPKEMTWNKWLYENVNICTSYDKELRNIARQFSQYHRLKYLGVSLSWFKQNRENIRLLFVEFPEIAEFWKQV